MNALKQINTIAKRLKSKNKKLSHTQAIKLASAEYRRNKKAGKVKPAKRKKVYKQSGKSKRSNDSLRAAKKPGYRKSKSGNVYFERRKNRSDAPGKMTGIDVPSQIRQEMNNVQQCEAKIWQLRKTSTKGMSYLMVSERKRQLAYYKKAKQMHKKNIVNLKRLI